MNDNPKAKETQASSSDNLATTGISWEAAFKSAEFVSGFKSLVNEVLHEARGPVERAQQLEQLGDPARTFRNDPATDPSQGMLNVPSFIPTNQDSAHTGPPANNQSNINSAVDNQTVEQLNRPSTVGALYNASPESAFVLGPGRSPIPAKLVKKIVSHEFIDLSELIPENLEEPPNELPSFSIVGAQIVTKPQPGKKRDISDILTWVECFNSYTAVLTSFFPTRARDLLAYMALIIRTSKRFGGMGWFHYDRAYRREAAASNSRDWSMMRPDLYHYHTAVTNTRQLDLIKKDTPPNTSGNRSFREEPRGSSTGRLLCHSWNAGFCNSNQQICRFRHICSFPDCQGYHRLLEHQRHVSAKRNRSPERRPKDSRRAFSR
ncbi:uncharacterized protein LOC114539351 [Dendronephthya gigantea]|uniref:uncharacterized protein LOC114539351 n=1 Tax=Dendronephthya gigantea TaxID=151771 RepID=UPI00106B8F5F|nr:uncharacterized protein LOC114539351 [Dendronephthya gigantea]